MSSPLRVLVADAEPDNRGLVVLALLGAGCLVTAVADGDAALRLLASAHHRFDLAILELELPGRPGDDVALAVRADPRSAHLALLCCTGRVALADRERVAAAGFDHLLAKPYRRDELAGAIDRALAAAGARGTAPRAALALSE